MVKSNKRKKNKGPRTYNHGADSRFVLCMLDQSGKWHTVFSRDRPGSRSRKVFSDDQIVPHLKECFNAGAHKQFSIPNCVFAYVGENQPGLNYKNALYHWKDGQWRNGAGHITAITNENKEKAVGKFMLCRLDKYGNWYKKCSTPSDRHDNQVMNDLAREFNGSREKHTTVFAYISANQMGFNYKNSLCHWTQATGWKQGQGEVPFVSKPVTFTQGKGSSFVLHVKVAGKWLPYFYSVDRTDKHSPTLFSEREIIEGLKKQFMQGGYQGNAFNPESVEEAYVMRISDKTKVEFWYKSTQKWTNQPIASKPQEKISKPDSSRLWFRRADGTATVFKFDTEHVARYEAFRQNMTENKPDLIERYTDLETGEVSEYFFEAFYWAYYAGMLNTASNGLARDVRIYFGPNSGYLQVRFTPNGAQPYISDLKAWPDKSFFFKIKVPKQTHEQG